MAVNAIDALRGVNLNWTVVLRDVWRDAEGDVPEIHQDLRRQFAAELDALASSAAQSSPTGWVITGTGGSGKTHLLGRFRAECFRRKICFVLVDMTDVRDFWDTVLLGYFTSLQEPIERGRTQFGAVIEGLLRQIKFKEPQEVVVRKLAAVPPANVRVALDRVLAPLHAAFPQQIALHGDVVRAVLAIGSNDYGIVNIANAWLQGEEVDAESKQRLGLIRARETSSSIVRGLSWLMSLGGASVVAMDQLDPIVTQLDLEREALESTRALAIINKLGAGMSELRDVTQRTLVVVSCIEHTWGKLLKNTPKPFTDRYHTPKILPPLTSERTMESLVAARMKQALSKSNFKPPYPSWPFKMEWLKTSALDNPREILQKCQAHLEECIRRGEVKELPPGWGTAPKPDSKMAPPDGFAEIDAKFEQLRGAVQVGPILDEEEEDNLLAPLIRSALRCVQKEWNLPADVDAILEENFTGGAATKPLHARLRLVFHKEKSREEHFCVRAMQKSNARAFMTRLRSAITQAGIDKELKFRRLAIVRQSSYPGGETTAKLLKQFEEFGGARVLPAEEEIRTLDALQTLEKAPPDGFSNWLKARRHASKTQLIQTIVPGFVDLVSAASKASADRDSTLVAASTGHPQEVENATTSTQSAAGGPQKVNEVKPIVSKSTADFNDDLMLGRQLIGENPSSKPTTIPLAALRKHGVVFAGAGSGKTVLLKRLIEGAALLGVPAIVIDCANDLAAIGDPWPSPPSQWRDGDAELAKQFFQKTERVVWTPGKESGNALGLAPLPDLTGLVASPEELAEAIIMSVEALSPVVATGSKTTIPKKQALLHMAFRFLAENGNCNLPGLAAVLRDLPPHVTTGIGDERKLAAAMADDLSAQLTINPLLSSSGPVLDPAVLFGGNGKTRISVISFIGLPTKESQQQFINQLAMTLFTWIKKNPAPPTVALRGILVIDEARDFVPAQKSTPCLGSMQRLAAQARKYGLGVILATQNPKDLDNKIVGQCSTQWYGKLNSPVAIDAAVEMLRSRGASSGDDVGGLKTGRFYVSNADHLTPPARLETPMCLSSHAGAMEPELILEKARACRVRSATMKL